MGSIADGGLAGPEDGKAPPIPEAAFPELPDIEPVAPEVGQKGLDPNCDGEAW